MQKFSPLLFIQASLYGSLRTIYKEKKKKKRPTDPQNKQQIQMIYIIKPRTPKKTPGYFAFLYVVHF